MKLTPKHLPLDTDTCADAFRAGFAKHCRLYLTPIARCGRRIPPDPDCVRRVIKDDRTSRKLLWDIFEHAPELLEHPLTSPAVKALYWAWRTTGELDARYGRGDPAFRASDCVRRQI